MKKIAVLKQTDLNNDYYLNMWLKAFRFWDFQYELIDFNTFDKADMNEYDMLLVTGVDEINPDSATKVDRYLRSGGKILVCGSMPKAIAGYFGGIRVNKIKRINRHRCIQICDSSNFLNWNKGEILFFTNTSGCLGTDYLIEDTTEMEAEIIAVSQEMSLVNPGTREWGEWSPSSSPSIIKKRVSAGSIMYIPIPIGAMEWVEQAVIPYFTSYPYVLENNGVLLLVRNILERLIEPENNEYKKLWPGNAKCVVCITGDVHDYPGIEGRYDREYKDMGYNFDVLKEYGLDGKATYYVCGAVAEKHPDEIREGLERGYELCPHTYQETQYFTSGWDYNTQRADIERCIKVFTKACPDSRAYTGGFRTHGYQSDLITREVLDDLGYEYIADMQGWEVTGKYNPSQPEGLVTYVAYPQNAVDKRGRKLSLLEIPDSLGNDHFAYRMKGWSPEEAFEFWKYEFDRIYRLEGMFQTCWHPYISLMEGAGREKTYRKMIEYMKSHDGVLFMTMGELCRWWKEKQRG